MWRGDSTELFFLDATLTMMAVEVGGEAAFTRGTPIPLFPVRLPRVTAPFGSNYAVSDDGQRFLVNGVVEGTRSAPITVVLNWTQRRERP